MSKELFRLKLKSLSYVSSVDTPAQETAVARLIKRKGGSQIQATARVAKLSDELGLVFGWALTTKADGVDYYDLHGDNILEDELIKIAAEWMSAGGAADTMHDREQDGRAVFCMPMTTEVAKAVYGDKIGGELGTYGLLVAIKPSPEDFAKFKSGELTGFSIDGTGIREPVHKALGYAPGERVTVDAAKAHMPEASGPGTVVEVSGNALGIVFDAAPSLVHRWYTLDEVAPEPGAMKRVARKSADKRYLTDEQMGHAHLAQSYDGGEPWMSDAMASGAECPHRHVIVRNPDGSLTVLADSGHTHTLTEQPQVLVVPDDAATVPEAVAARAAGESPRSQKSQNVNLVIKENAVDPTQELADLKTLQGKLQAKIAELEAQLADATTQASLTDGEKAHLASLSAPEQKRFVALEKSARLAEVAKAAEADAVVVEFNGQQYRKSAGPAVIELAKAAKAQADMLAKQADDIKKARIRKVASEILKNAPGDAETHDFIVEQLEGNEKAMAALKGLVATSTIGKSAPGIGGAVDDDDSPQGEFDALVAKYATDNKVDASKARLEVVKTSEGRRLYGEIEDLRKRMSLGGR